jgi:hypothetical protein
MANEQLRLPTGLSAEDYTFGDGSLLDYTPPNVQWQAPLAPQGESVFGNYVKAHDDLLKTYNRRLARPTGTTGALPLDTSGRPQSMESYGLQHWNEFGSDEDRNLYESLGLWGDPGRSPYIGYGGGTAAGAAISGSQARLPQPSVSGYEYAYPIYSRYSHPSGHYGGEERYQPGRLNHPFISYYTKDIDKYPYFPTLPADLAGGVEYNNEPYILVGQTLVPAGDRDEIFSYS